jgi:hypothetical protein
MLTTLFWLIVGHAIADTSLQPENMAKGKNRNRPIDMSRVPPGQVYQKTWPFFLTYHAFVHGGAVALATGNVYLGLAEVACHWMIDFGKCESWYGIKTDQGLHMLCKLLWLGLLYA